MMNGRPAMIANPMCAMASNGQMVMANQVQIGNPAQLQGNYYIYKSAELVQYHRRAFWAHTGEA